MGDLQNWAMIQVNVEEDVAVPKKKQEATMSASDIIHEHKKEWHTQK